MSSCSSCTCSAVPSSSKPSSSSSLMDDRQIGSGLLSKGWFIEKNEQWPGHALLLQVEEILMDEKSEYQHVFVFRSTSFGNVLVLDGVVQITERDECSYQEMIAHLPVFAHPNPRRVLVIGGGDGGVIRELVKHQSIEHITICEIDHKVIEAGKKFFPAVASAWNDSRVHLHVGDGSAYMLRDEVKGQFDVIITDSSDPVGPAQALFESPFYQAMHGALRAGGIACTQAESIWENLTLIAGLVRDSLVIFDSVQYATTQIPTYPAGQIGFLLCGKGTSSCAFPTRGPSFDLHYYSEEMHRAAFRLPAFAQKKLDQAQTEGKKLRETVKEGGKVHAKNVIEHESVEKALNEQRSKADTEGPAVQ